MNRNDIVRQYKWMRVLRVFLEIFSLILLFLSFYLAFLIPLFFCIYLFEKLGPNGGCLFIFYGVFMVIMMLVFVYKIDELKKKKSIERLLLMPSNALLRHYEKKWGMTEQQIKTYIAKREELGKHMDIYVFPYITKFCNLNGEGRKEQETFLSGFLSEDEITLVYRQICSDSLMIEMNKYWRKRSLSEKKILLSLLFKLAIMQDGIRNDEWNLLMNIMMQWGFNKYYIEFYKNRYSPLRTEFDESEYRSNVSKQDRTVSYLKPFYEILGLEETATDDEIKRAYHNLALQHHPDLPKNSDRVKECETLMAKINEAYEKVRN